MRNDKPIISVTRLRRLPHLDSLHEGSAAKKKNNQQQQQSVSISARVITPAVHGHSRELSICPAHHTSGNHTAHIYIYKTHIHTV